MSRDELTRPVGPDQRPSGITSPISRGWSELLATGGGEGAGTMALATIHLGPRQQWWGRRGCRPTTSTPLTQRWIDESSESHAIYHEGDILSLSNLWLCAYTAVFLYILSIFFFSFSVYQDIIRKSNHLSWYNDKNNVIYQHDTMAILGHLSLLVW